MQPQLPKGTREFKPEDKILRDKIVNTLKEVFELYGYAPLETPILERFDALASKYAGGAEILKEAFKLKDQGQRELGLRYDLTVPLAIYIATNPNIKLPFKRYEIGEVFRDGPITSARYRQFAQCDVDIVGCKELLADAEIMALTDSAFKKIGLDAYIKVNNRKLLDDVLNFFGIDESKFETAILSLDKLEKFGTQVVKNELIEKNVEDAVATKIIDIVKVKGTNIERISKLKNILKKSDGLKEVEGLLGYLELMGIKAEFDASLARGLAYYTGTVFEIFLANSNVKSAVAAGGRYDKMIGSLVGNKEYPAVGISFGLDRIYDALIEKQPTKVKTPTKAYVVPIKMLGDAINIVKTLRQNGINSDIDLMGRSPSKNLEYANSLGVPHVIFVGEEEIKQNKVKLRDMKSGKEEMLTMEDVIKKLKQ